MIGEQTMLNHPCVACVSYQV